MKRVLLLLFSIVSLSVTAQKLVSGRVFEQSGPIQGATVVVEGSTFGTVTDINGYFSLECGGELPVTLEVRFLGYEDLRV